MGSKVFWAWYHALRKSCEWRTGNFHPIIFSCCRKCWKRMVTRYVLFHTSTYNASVYNWNVHHPIRRLWDEIWHSVFRVWRFTMDPMERASAMWRHLLISNFRTANSRVYVIKYSIYRYVYKVLTMEYYNRWQNTKHFFRMFMRMIYDFIHIQHYRPFSLSTDYIKRL